MIKAAAKASHMKLEAWYARINWSAHLLPMVKLAVERFCASDSANAVGMVHLSVASEAYARGHYRDSKKELWGDSLTISLGTRGVPVKAVVPVAGRLRVLAEERAALVLSQALSGGVVALLYPPKSDTDESVKPSYMVGYWFNPREIRLQDLDRLLTLTGETDLFCGSEVFPNRRGARVLAKLHAKDSALSTGGSKIWIWLQYIFKVVGGTLRIYGIGTPSPK